MAQVVRMFTVPAWHPEFKPQNPQDERREPTSCPLTFTCYSMASTSHKQMHFLKKKVCLAGWSQWIFRKRVLNHSPLCLSCTLTLPSAQPGVVISHRVSGKQALCWALNIPHSGLYGVLTTRVKRPDCKWALSLPSLATAGDLTLGSPVFQRLGRRPD